jgi:hypothetical protein
MFHNDLTGGRLSKKLIEQLIGSHITHFEWYQLKIDSVCVCFAPVTLQCSPHFTGICPTAR